MRIKKINNKAAPHESYERQTKMSWAILLTCLKDVPPEFQPFFNSLQLKDAIFPYAVITPSYEGFMHRAQAQLVCLMDDAVYLADKGDTVAQALCVKYTDVHYIQFGTVLLDTHVQIRGIDCNGHPAMIHLRFNTVSDSLFKKIITTIRQTWFKGTATRDDFSYATLEAANLKLSNFTRHSILAGERVKHLIWQPELRRSKIKIHIPFLANSILYQTIFPNHVTVMTDDELILIRETERITHDDRYGGTWEYIPLTKIQSVVIIQNPDGLMTVEIELPTNQRIENRYIPTECIEIEILLNELNNLKNK